MSCTGSYGVDWYEHNTLNNFLGITIQESNIVLYHYIIGGNHPFHIWYWFNGTLFIFPIPTKDKPSKKKKIDIKIKDGTYIFLQLNPYKLIVLGLSIFINLTNCFYHWFVIFHAYHIDITFSSLSLNLCLSLVSLSLSLSIEVPLTPHLNTISVDRVTSYPPPDHHICQSRSPLILGLLWVWFDFFFLFFFFL